MVRAVVEEATMDNREEIFDALNDFEKKPTKEIPPLLEQFLRRVAKTGETLFPWPKLKPLFVSKLNQVMTQFQQEIAVDHFPPNSNMEQVKFDDMRDRIISAVERFHGAPFTIQRLCELITEPKRHYKRSDKFLRGIEKNVLVVSTVDPFGRKIVSESRTLVNGLDTNGCQPANTFPPPPIPNWTTNNPGVTAVWPQTNIECTEEEERHSNGKDDNHPTHRDTELEEQREFEEKEEALNTSLERTEDEQLSPIKEEPERTVDHPSVEDADTTDATGDDTRVEEPVQEESREVTPVSTSEADTVDAPPEKMRKIEEKEEEDSKSVPESSTEDNCISSPQNEISVHPDVDAEAESVPPASEGTQVSSTAEDTKCESGDITEKSDSTQEDSPSSTDPPTQAVQEQQQQPESDSKLTEDLESKHTEDCDSTVPAVDESTEQTSVSSCGETKEENGESSPSICEKSDPLDSSEQVMDTESDSCLTSESVESESSPHQSKDQDSSSVPSAEMDKVTQEEEPMDQD